MEEAIGSGPGRGRRRPVVAHKEFEEERAGKESGWEVRQILFQLHSQPLELGLLERGDGAAQQRG